MLKKLLVVASLAFAAIAVPGPASASALLWDGSHEDSLTGFVSFGNPEPGQTKFGCPVHVGIEVTGDTSTGRLTSFEPTTEFCEGEGALGFCFLTEAETTLPETTSESLAKLHLVGEITVTMTTPFGNPIVLIYRYDPECPIEKSVVTVSDLHLTTKATDLTTVAVSGVAQAHTFIRGSGEVTQNVAFFTPPFLFLGTSTDTILFE